MSKQIQTISIAGKLYILVSKRELSKAFESENNFNAFSEKITTLANGSDFKLLVGNAITTGVADVNN